MKIYIASSFAYKDKKIANERKKKIEEAANLLRNRGFDVYVPHEHTIDHAWDYPNKEWALMVFTNDMMAIKDCDVVVMLSYGKVQNNAGVDWECGYAYGIGKKVIVVMMNEEIESLMVVNGSYDRIRGIDRLNDYDFDSMTLLRDEPNEQS